MTSLTLPMLIVALYGMLGRHGYGRALAFGGVAAAGAALVVGGVAVPAFYAVALGAVVALVLPWFQAGRRIGTPPPGVPMLLALLVWSMFVTIVAPFLFDGLHTITPSNAVLTAGVVTSSNIAQIGYLAIGVAVVAFIARDEHAGPELVGITAGVAVLLSLWSYLNGISGLPYPTGFFDNSPSFAYIETAAGGISRFRGIFSEPSALAGACLVMICYGVSRARNTRGGRRLGALLLAAIATYLGVVSTATTFVVAGVALAAIVVLASLFGLVSRTTRLSALLAIVACLLVLVAAWALPTVAAFAQDAVTQKVAGSSYGERSSADSESYRIFFDTWGFGVGLGSGRASSVVPTLLSTVGLIGALLFVATVVLLVGRARLVDRYRPVIWSLVAVLVTKAIAGPDLSDPTGLSWITLGLLSKAALNLAPKPAVVPELLERRIRAAEVRSVGAGRVAS